MPEDPLPEVAACRAAEKALRDFESHNRGKLEALQKIAAMLSRGGWGAVQFDEDTLHSARPPHHVPASEAVSLRALGGGSIARTVVEWRRLYNDWRQKYELVPRNARDAAAHPPPRTRANVSERLRRA